MDYISEANKFMYEELDEATKSNDSDPSDKLKEISKKILKKEQPIAKKPNLWKFIALIVKTDRPEKGEKNIQLEVSADNKNRFWVRVAYGDDASYKAFLKDETVEEIAKFANDSLTKLKK